MGGAGEPREEGVTPGDRQLGEGSPVLGREIEPQRPVIALRSGPATPGFLFCPEGHLQTLGVEPSNHFLCCLSHWITTRTQEDPTKNGDQAQTRWAAWPAAAIMAHIY